MLLLAKRGCDVGEEGFKKWRFSCDVLACCSGIGELYTPNQTPHPPQLSAHRFGESSSDWPRGPTTSSVGCGARVRERARAKACPRRVTPQAHEVVDYKGPPAPVTSWRGRRRASQGSRLIGVGKRDKARGQSALPHRGSCPCTHQTGRRQRQTPYKRGRSGSLISCCRSALTSRRPRGVTVSAQHTRGLQAPSVWPRKKAGWLAGGRAGWLPGWLSLKRGLKRQTWLRGLCRSILTWKSSQPPSSVSGASGRGHVRMRAVDRSAADQVRTRPCDGSRLHREKACQVPLSTGSASVRFLRESNVKK